MNKEQFLLELRQYLTFISAEERAQVLDEYMEKLDAVGEAGEATLIPQLGTPMMIAIALKRRKEAGEPLTDHAPAPKAAQEDEAPEVSAEAEVPAENSFETESEDPEEAKAGEESAAETSSPEVKPKAGAGAVISCVLMSLLSVVLSLAIVAVGAYCFVVFGNLLVVAFQSLNTVTDALLLFAGALVSGGVGIVLTWLGIWTGIRLITKQLARLHA